MARLNVEKTIETAKGKIPYGYTMSCNTMKTIYNNNSGDVFGIMCDVFYLGCAQGMKVAKAKMREGAIR